MRFFLFVISSCCHVSHSRYSILDIRYIRVKSIIEYRFYSPEIVSFTKSLNNPATYLTVGMVFAYDMRMGPNTPSVPCRHARGRRIARSPSSTDAVHPIRLRRRSTLAKPPMLLLLVVRASRSCKVAFFKNFQRPPCFIRSENSGSPRRWSSRLCKFHPRLYPRRGACPAR
jgi:hypothetical protein